MFTPEQLKNGTMNAVQETRRKVLDLLGLEDTGQSSRELADRVRIALTDDRIFLMENDTVFINEAMIKDGQIDPMCGNRTSKEIVVNVDMSRLAQCADNVERLAKSIRQTLQDSVKAGLPRLGGKLITAEDFKPGCSPHEFAGGLLRMAPITSNGKAPVNILPQGVDYKD